MSTHEKIDGNPKAMNSRFLLFVTTYFAVVSAEDCESWCIHPCGELNGLPSYECSGCDSEKYLCRPGQRNFNKTADPDIMRVAVAAHGETAGDGNAYSSHSKPLQMPTAYLDEFEVGGCDLESVDHTAVTRGMLMRATKPFIIKGLTHNWTAHTAWVKSELLRVHGTEPFQLHATNHAQLKDLLKIEGKYHMGHAVYPPGGCYSDPWRPYSPMLFGALASDYWLPRYLGPMVTFQMGVGSGYGIGVPPENHPSSWFAVIKGTKRWVLMPPNAGSSRNGGPGTEPPSVMNQRFGKGKMCVPNNKPMYALHCDQQEGDMIWVPDYWWHETCGLDNFSIGLGALTYDGCCPDVKLKQKHVCNKNGHTGVTYGVHDIPSCQNGERTCAGLPFPSHEGLS